MKYIMYTVKREKVCTRLDGNGNIQTCYLMHITVDAIADIPDAKENWLAGSRCDVLEDGGHVYMLSNGREWVEVNFFDRVSEGDSTDLSNYYTKSQVNNQIAEKIAEIVADAPENFDTLKEISDWISSHEDSAAAMNSQIQQNTASISSKVDKISGMGLSQNSFTTAEKTKLDGLANYDDSVVKSQNALNRSTLGYQRKNLLKNTSASITQNGVTFTVNSDGSVTVSGTAQGSNWFVLSTNNRISSGKYILTSGINGYGENLMVAIAPTKSIEQVILNSNQSAKELSNQDGLIYAIRIQNGFTANDVTIYPMLRYADITDDTYEPYVDDLQTQINAMESVVDTSFIQNGNISGGSGGDLDTATKNGIYRFYGNPLNSPISTTNSYGILLVFRTSGSAYYSAQVAIAAPKSTAFGTASDSGIFIRTTTDSSNGEWSEWKKFSLTDII